MATAKLPETNSGVVTSWVPITTAYPSVRGCDQLYWSVVANTVAAWDPGYGILVADSSCLPRPATTWWNQDRLGRNTETVFSIGPITCPQAYYTAKTSVKDSSSTLVGCCPIGYTFASLLGNGNTGQCVSNLDAGQVITYAVEDQGGNWIITTQSILSRTTVAGIQVNGWVFAQETSTASTACAAATVTVDGLPAATAPSTDNGLSSGAKAGIGVGVALGVIGLLTLLAGLWMMRRARKRESDYGAAPLAQHAQAHDPRYPAGYGGWPVETTASPMTKMATTTAITNVDGGNINGTTPNPGFTHRTYDSSGTISSHLGGSTVRGTPVELPNDMPTELPVNYTSYAEPEEGRNKDHNGGGGLRYVDSRLPVRDAQGDTNRTVPGHTTR